MILNNKFNMRWLLLALAGALASSASAQLVVFEPASGYWNVPGNWSSGSVPTNGQSPDILNGGKATVTNDVGNCGNTYVGQGNYPTLTGTVLFRPGAVLTTAALLLGRDSTNYGQFSQSGGILTVNGYVSVGDAADGSGCSGEYDLSGGLLQLPVGGSYVQVGNQGVGRMVVAGSAVLDTPLLAVGNTAATSGSQLFQWGGTINVTNLTIGSTAGESNCSYTISAGAVQWGGLMLIQDLMTVQGTKCSLLGSASGGVGLQITGSGTLQLQLDALGIEPILLNGSQLAIAAGSKLIVDGSQYARWNGNPGSFTLIHHGGYGGQMGFTSTNVTFVGFGNLTPSLVYSPNTVTLVLSQAAGTMPQSGQGLLCEYWQVPITVNPSLNNRSIPAPLSVLPDFTNTLVAEHPIYGQVVSNFDLSGRLQDTNYFMRFSGYINVPTNGSYTFYLNSDDGSKLWLDGALLVNNDGVHGAQEVSGVTNLAGGMHSLVVGYFQAGGNQSLSVSWSGPGLGKQAIPNTALFLSAQNNQPVRQPIYQNIVQDSEANYNYAPSFMYDEVEGLYKIWMCGNGIPGCVGGDNILYREATSLQGLMTAPLSVALQPSLDPTKFDQIHACDPNVYRVGNLLYMGYGGNTDGSQLVATTRLGMAISYDGGRTFQRLNNGNAIISPSSPDANLYGIGQPAVAQGSDGYYYMIYTDVNATNSNVGGDIRVIRSLDPAFSPGNFTTVATLTINSVGGASLDLGYDTNKAQFIIIVNQSPVNTLEYFNTNWSYDHTVVYTNNFGWQFGEGIALLMNSKKQPMSYLQDGVPSYGFSASVVDSTNDTSLWANWVAGDLKYLVVPQTLTPVTNLINNGNFLANAFQFTNSPGYLLPWNSGNPSSITGWSNLSNLLVGVNGTATSVGDAFGPTSTGGDTYAFIQGGVNGLAQNLTLTAYTTYQLDFDVAARAGNMINYQVQIGDGSQVYFTVTNVANNAAFVHVTATFTTPSTLKGTPSIQLLELTPGDNTVDFANLSLIMVGSKGSTQTGLTLSPNSSIYGGLITLTATVRTTNGIPTGMVTFMDGANVLGSTVLGSGSGITATAVLTLTNLAAATHSLTASYGGDTNYAGSLSNVRVLTVNPSSTTTTMVSSQNPSLPSQNVIFTTAVRPVPPGAGTPTNAVQFLTNGATATVVYLNASAQAAYATSMLPHGSNVIVAQYVTDGNFLASTNSLTQLVNTPPVANPLVLGAVSGLPTTLKIIGGVNGPTDADGDPLVITAVGVPTNGIASTDGTNTTYTATNNFTGADVFNYIVSDNYGAKATNAVLVNVITNSAGLNYLSASLTGGNIVLSFLGIPWNRYTLEQTYSLAPAGWLPVVTNLAPANGLLQFTNPTTGTNSFWRIQNVP